MRRRFGQALRIAVAPGGVTLLAVSRWGSAAPVQLAELRLDHSTHPEELGAAVRAVLADAGCARWPATIVLADELVRIWHVTPPAGSTRLADLEAAAALRFQSLFGDSAQAWKIAAGWDAAHPFLAAAMPRALLAQLEAACAEQGIALVGIVPQFVAAYNQWRASVKPGAWYGNVHDSVLTLGALEHGAIRAVRAAAIPGGATAGWLAQHVAREALRLNLAAPAALCVSGPAPSAWSGGDAALACTLLGSRA